MAAYRPLFLPRRFPTPLRRCCLRAVEEPWERRDRVLVQPPLCERNELHLVGLEELMLWKDRAERQISVVGGSLVKQDGGPDAAELRRELEWLLDDAVRGCIRYDEEAGGEKQDCSWQEVKKSNNKAWMAGGMSVLSRASMSFLQAGWKQRVEERRPFQYLVGCAHWRDLVLSVQEGVLIPRPETEQLIDLAGAAIARNPSLAEGEWLDLGTGSGAIAIALHRLLQGAGRVSGVDISPVAVAVAQANVARYCLQAKVRVETGSWSSALAASSSPPKLAGVVSNPPYIPTSNLHSLQAEVSKHEPWSALDGGSDGLDHLRTICHGSATALQPAGFLALETNGAQQAHQVAHLLLHEAHNSFRDVQIVADFAGIDRFVTAFHT